MKQKQTGTTYKLINVYCLNLAGVHSHLYRHGLARPGVDVSSFTLVDDSQRDRVVKRYLLVRSRVHHSFNEQTIL